MAKACCCETINHSNIKVEDSGGQAVFTNGERDSFTKIRVDGCEITEGPRADWALERGNDCLIIELKGRDVERAANQIIETAVHWRTLNPTVNLAGLIVARQYPKATSTMQIKKQRFTRDFGGPLHVLTHSPTLKFDNVFRFSGILKD